MVQHNYGTSFASEKAESGEEGRLIHVGLYFGYHYVGEFEEYHQHQRTKLGPRVRGCTDHHSPTRSDYYNSTESPKSNSSLHSRIVNGSKIWENTGQKTCEFEGSKFFTAHA